MPAAATHQLVDPDAPAARPAGRARAHLRVHAAPTRAAGASRAAADRSAEPDTLTRYLHDIAAYPLITRAEEGRLARRIADGDREALDTLVRANLRFVVSVAKRYQNHGVPLMDLISEGNLGLIRAAHRFDPGQGVKFISYAVWWIRQAITQALSEQGRMVRVPHNKAGALHRLGRRAAALEQALCREATPAEIAEGTDYGVEEVAQILSIPWAHVSLDAPLTPGADNALIDHLADDAGDPPDAPVLEDALHATVETSLATLRDRERQVLRLYYGFDGEPMTLEAIGARLGITRERVRQLREKALGRLRRSRVAAPLKQFV